MLNELYSTVAMLPDLLVHPDRWSSLIINRRKPYTYRVFTQINGLRVCLHKFNSCDRHEAFRHPHPWPGAFLILEGAYQMWLGRSPDRESEPVEVAETLLTEWSAYQITDPLTWHGVVPVCDTYTVMVNGSPWSAEVAHTSVVTTKGKDLDQMAPGDLEDFLGKFRDLVGHYLDSSRHR